MVIFSFVAIANTKTLTENYLAQFKELEKSAVIDYMKFFNRVNNAVTAWSLFSVSKRGLVI